MKSILLDLEICKKLEILRKNGTFHIMQIDTLLMTNKHLNLLGLKFMITVSVLQSLDVHVLNHYITEPLKFSTTTKKRLNPFTTTKFDSSSKTFFLQSKIFLFRNFFTISIFFVLVMYYYYSSKRKMRIFFINKAAICSSSSLLEKYCQYISKGTWILRLYDYWDFENLFKIIW